MPLHPLRHDVNEQPYRSSTIPHDVRQRRRERLHELLTQTHVHDRYRLMSPGVPEFATGCVSVHSEAMLIDDKLLLVGSANLNNRSMVLDTECNIAIDAHGDPRIQRALALARNTLLAGHLGRKPEAVAQEISERRSMNEAIAVLLKSPAQRRTLERPNPTVSQDSDRLVPFEALIDPEKLVEPDELVEQFVPVEKPRRLSGSFALLGMLAAADRWFSDSLALDADIDCDGETWRVGALHPGPASRDRRTQVEQVLQNFDPPAMPVILLGDLSEWFIYGRTLRRLVSHFYRARSPKTFPTRYPMFALDRIRVHTGERLVRVDVHRRLLGRGGIGSLSIDRAAILVALKQTLVTKTP